MKSILVIVVIAVIAYLIINSSKQKDPVATACAADVIQLLKKRKDANADEIAEIFRQHEIDENRVDHVTTLIKTRLRQANISKDEQAIVMLEIRKAKTQL